MAAGPVTGPVAFGGSKPASPTTEAPPHASVAELPRPRVTPWGRVRNWAILLVALLVALAWIAAPDRPVVIGIAVAAGVAAGIALWAHRRKVEWARENPDG